jgi:hypothetical protein
MTIQEHCQAVAREFRASQPNSAHTFIAMCRKLGKVPGLSKTAAMEIARELFPGSHKAFLKAEEQGKALPQLFPKKSASTYEQRRAAALARGNCIT